MDRLKELTEWMEAFRARIQELADKDTLDDAERTEWDQVNAGFDAMKAEATPLRERQARLELAATRTIMAATGDGAAAAGAARAAFQVAGKPSAEEIYDRSNLDYHNPNDGQAYRDRALAAIDSWRSTPAEWKESAARLVEMADDAEDGSTARQVADHILRFGNPVYVRAFKKFLRGGAPVLPLLEPDEARAFRDGMDYSRAVNEGTVSAGQAIVPPFLDPTIILTNTGVVNPFRQLSTVKTITTQTWKGVTSAGVTAEWTAEAAEMTDASPTFVQPTITPVRADAYIQASFESIEDTSLATDVAMLFADARDRLEGAAFATGTGSTQPFGIVTELQLTTASRTAANTNGSIGLVDLYNLDSNLSPRFRPNASFVMNKGIINIVRQAVIPSLTNFSPWVDFGGAVPAKAIGYPVYEASGMQGTLSTATASNDDVIILGDFRQGYFIVDRIGMSVAYNPLVLGANRRPTGEVGWAAFWRVGAATVNAAAFQMLRV